MLKANTGACVVRCGGIGDNLVASSVLLGLKQRYGFVEVISQRPWHVVFENNPHIDKLTVHDADDIKPEGIPDWHWIRAKEFEHYVNLSHSMEFTLAFFPAEFQFQWPAEARRKVANKSYAEMAHDIALLPYDEIAPGFFPTDDERGSAEVSAKEVGGRFILWVIRGTRLDKVYPHSGIAVSRLLRETGLPVILAGGPKDYEFASALHDDVVKMNGDSRGLHIAVSPSAENDTWPVRRSLSLAQRADLVIGPDTGTMWSVAVRDMPKIVMLSHASAENITKWWKNTTTLHADPARVDCFPCHRLHDVFATCRPNKENSGAACISDIPIEAVVAAAQHALSAPRPAGYPARAPDPGVIASADTLVALAGWPHVKRAALYDGS